MSTNGTHSLPSCSVVVCTHDRPAELERCLTGLSGQTVNPKEILVVDNASGDERALDISRRFGARYVQEPKLGLSRARNRGAAEATGEIVAYLDDDAYPEANWLANLLNVFHDAEIMAAGGRTIAPTADAETQELCKLIQGPGTNMKTMVVDKSHPQWFEITAFGGIGTGMNMAFRRTAFDHVPGFDTRLGLPDAAGEEQFAVFNLVDRGFKAAYAPDAVVTHPTTFTVEGLRRRYFAACSYATSYILFLLMNVPQHRRDLLKFLFEAARGVKREWRSGGPNGTHHVIEVSRMKVMSARLQGVWKYATSRRAEDHSAAVNGNGQVHFAKSSP